MTVVPYDMLDVTRNIHSTNNKYIEILLEIRRCSYIHWLTYYRY